MAGHMTDEQRRKLQDAIAAALLLIYRDRAKAAMTRLAAQEAQIGVPLNVREKIDAFARDRAQQVQTGINRRLDKALAGLPETATDADKAQAVAAARRDVERYNAAVLTPFLTSWAAQQAQSDVYGASTLATGQNARAGTQWIWTRGSGSDEPDSCGDAQDASPNDYDTLVSIGGGIPPIHPHCQCSIDPVT